jgi:hypothetical protein
MTLVTSMPVAAVARLVRVHDTRLYASNRSKKPEPGRAHGTSMRRTAVGAVDPGNARVRQGMVLEEIQVAPGLPHGAQTNPRRDFLVARATLSAARKDFGVWQAPQSERRKNYPAATLPEEDAAPYIIGPASRPIEFG